MSKNLSTQINSSENNDHFENLLFNISLVKLKLDHNDDLFVKALNNKPVKDYKAVVNLENEEIFSVVSNDYDLIPNRTAFIEGKRLFRKLTGIEEDGLRPFKVVSSKRRTFCHVDFVNQNYNPIKFKQDTWLPFLRVTNSYNKTYLLRYQIGFVRALCSNGLIFDEESIVLKKAHIKSNGDFEVDAEIRADRFRELKNSFINSMDGLFKYNVPRKHVLSLAYKILSLKFQVTNSIENIRNKALEQQKAFETKVDELTNQYYEELEPTAYAVLNVLTDLISHENYDVIPNYSGRESGLQKKTYEWARSFPDEINRKDFSWSQYLQN